MLNLAKPSIQLNSECGFFCSSQCRYSICNFMLPDSVPSRMVFSSCLRIPSLQAFRLKFPRLCFFRRLSLETENTENCSGYLKIERQYVILERLTILGFTWNFWARLQIWQDNRSSPFGGIWALSAILWIVTEIWPSYLYLKSSIPAVQKQPKPLKYSLRNNS